MTSKERLLNVIKGRITDCLPVAPHWWGLYKFQLSGLAKGYMDERKCWNMHGARLAEVDELFYKTYKPDWFHLSCGWDELQENRKQQRLFQEVRRNLKLLDSKALIDEYVHLKYMNEQEILKGTRYDHVKILSEKYGDSVFIALNEGNPICEILDPDGPFQFEEGLVALLEKPEMMEYLIFREYEMKLENIKALKKCGCHGYIGSETYCTPDLISPDTYRSLVFPAQQYFYNKVKEIGLVPIVYFLGDILPLIHSINHLGAEVLLVEEPKKGYILDVVEIRKVLDQSLTLFGNVDSIYTLLKGSPKDVEQEARRQAEAANYGSFVIANGSPIAFDTPMENIKTILETARIQTY
jgi:Uroporphyrinogen-III decarboxylase